MIFLENFLFNQDNIEGRRNYLLTSLILVIITLIIFGPYHSLLIDYTNIIFTKEITPYGLFDIFLRNKFAYSALRYSIIIPLAISLILKNKKWFLLISLLLFHIFQYIHYKVTPYAWNFNTHLSFFLLAFVIAEFLKGSKYEKEFHSFSISFPLIYIGCLYFQAGLSKLIYGGTEWISTGRTLTQFTYFIGTDMGKLLLSLDHFPQIVSFGTVMLELSIIFIIFFKKFRPVLGIVLILFHTGIYLTMNILFWHLIFLYPALFFPEVLEKRRVLEWIRLQRLF